MGSFSLLAYPFRPFFLLVGLYGAFLIIAWAGFLFAHWQLPFDISPVYWHSHEMLFGMVPAAIAGFVLTAMTNWTNAPPLKNTKLLLLVLLWMAGRFLFVTSGELNIPFIVVSIVDLSFLPIMAIYIAQIIIKAKNYRNLVMILMMALLTVSNLFTHIGIIKSNFGMFQTGQNLAFNTITLMMIVVAGRITPTFSINWLKRKNRDFSSIKTYNTLDKLSIGSSMLLVLINIFIEEHWGLGWLILFVGFTNSFRLYFWRGWKLKREPLLWILHLGYFWINVALILRGLSFYTHSLSPSLWQHTLGAGAMGTLIFGVMTRVSLGHTGREIKLPAFGRLIFYAISLAAVFRLVAAVQWLDFRLGILLTSFFWIVACGLFVVLYWPILSKPRADGRPG